MGEYLAPEDTEAKPVLSEHHIHNLLTLAVGIKIVGPAGLRHTKTIDGLFFVVPLKNYIGPQGTTCIGRDLFCRKSIGNIGTGTEASGGSCHGKKVR